MLEDDGHAVTTAASAEEALERIDESRPDAIVLDVRLPGMDGLTALGEIREQSGDAPVIIMTAHGNLDTAVQAVRKGAFDYLPKPFDLNKAADVVQRALASRNGNVDEAKPHAESSSELLVGSSPAMQEVFKQIALVAGTDVPVLITGESGTGKEMVARAIHTHGHRAGHPFLPICLAALSAGLVESELFGHVKGAFTGASQNRAGLLELAEGGTVLLDEIAETEPGLQVKLLRALEQREITPVGDARPKPFNARILAATNKPLPEMIADGRFRDDLYFRLSVFRVHLPPLRDRVEDISLLAEHFLRRCSPVDAAIEFRDDAIEELQRRRWPGNVRELRNAVEHAAVLARGAAIERSHLPAEDPLIGVGGATLDDGIAARIAEWVQRELDAGDAEKLYDRFLDLCEPPLLEAILKHVGDHKTQAAELLGMHRTTLRQKLRKHRLDDA